MSTINPPASTLRLVTPDDPGTERVSVRKLRRFRSYERPTFVARFEDAGDHVGRVRTVYVCDPVTPAMRDYPGLVAAGWECYNDGGRWPTLRRDGTAVRWLGAWVGDRTLTPEAAATLWAMIEARCARLAPHAVPIGAPSTTGRDLWLRLIPAGGRWPVLPDDVQQSLRDAGGQGRIELLPAPHDEPVPVFEYDARLAYLSVLRGLPVGVPRVIEARDCDTWVTDNPYAPGRFAVEWEAPAGWPHEVGLLPSWGTYPLAGAGVVDAGELHLAIEHGWRVRFDGGYAWTVTGDPYRTWADRLVAESASPPPGADRAVWRAVWRAVALQTIGAMHGRARRVSVFGATTAAPADNDTVSLVGGGGARWVIEQPAAWPDTHHPEWTTTIWARARRRLLDAPAGFGIRAGALHARFHVVGFRTDAIYTTALQDWPDDGALGRYRLKRAAPPAPWPATQAEMLARLDAVTP